MGYDPITWRNVTGPSLADASRPLESAQNMISGAFGSLNSVLQKSESTDRANWQQQKENNLNSFMNTIYAAKGPEEFKRMQDSGELNQMITGFGAQIDQSAARGVMDTRLNTLQQREKQGIEYGNFMMDEKQRPIVQQIMSEAALGNKDNALKLMAANPDLRMPADLTKAIVSGERDLTKWNFEKDKMPLELQGLKLGNEGKGITNRLGNLQITETKQRVDDATAVRNLENTIAKAGADWSTQRDGALKAQGGLVGTLNSNIADAKMKYPVDARGNPDFSLFTKEQIQSFDQSARVTGTPLASTTMGGDTNRADQFLAQLHASGKYAPRILKAQETAIRSAFNTPMGERGLVGNDAWNRDVSNAQSKVAYDNMDANNWYAPGSPNAVRAYEDLAKEVDKMFGPQEREDLPDVQKYLSELATKGMVVGKDSKGKDIVVTPSVNDIMGAVRGTYEGWNFFNSGRKDDIKKQLEAALKTSEAATRFKQGQDSQEYRNTQRVKEELAKARAAK